MISFLAWRRPGRTEPPQGLQVFISQVNRGSRGPKSSEDGGEALLRELLGQGLRRQQVQRRSLELLAEQLSEAPERVEGARLALLRIVDDIFRPLRGDQAQDVQVGEGLLGGGKA